MEEEIVSLTYRKPPSPEDRINQVFQTLTYREREVLKTLNGINSRRRKRSYGYIAEYFDVSVTRVKQIEQRAIKKLTHPVRRKLWRGISVFENMVKPKKEMEK